MQALERGAVQSEAFVSKGMLSFCLRCLACQDEGLRQLALSAVELFRASLNEDNLSFR